jgi:rhodanese-related sulfurtransferase
MPYKTAVDLIAEAKSRIREVSAADTVKAVAGSNAPLILDVREINETNLGRIKGALLIPRGSLETKVEAIIPREAKVIIYCASGNRSAFAAETLQNMGYQDVASMAGGWQAWMGLGGPVEG